MKQLKVGERVTITLEAAKARGCSGCIFAWVKDIAPIPITPEILEKNGWKRVDDEPVDFEIEYFGTKFSNGVNLFYNVSSDIYRYGKHTIMIYLHELQHLFFGLGLKQEMEV